MPFIDWYFLKKVTFTFGANNEIHPIESLN